ncbi:type I toxin-antitoxin system Ibs family toxin [Escherichia coli]|nr:type I toxin-antitoxin system Ibs family toxin [Escherichia coli]MBW6098124.1 type I toxin-antitoxin system Ibs family toxin [Escherichia coli]MBW6101111.1 type I toxin-antitoxin system Ibs family toxin [Escherichia coli]QED66269.1 type I toxin-antitoxin system Ibs family toxin [Escherichia coli]
MMKLVIILIVLLLVSFRAY